jgi:hypothetical protein
MPTLLSGASGNPALRVLLSAVDYLLQYFVLPLWEEIQ